MGRQGQPRGAHCMHLSDHNGWSQDPPLPRPHLKVSSGGEGISCWRFLPTWDILKVSTSSSFVSVSVAAVFGLNLICCSLGLCYLATIAVLSVTLQHYNQKLFTYRQSIKWYLQTAFVDVLETSSYISEIIPLGFFFVCCVFYKLSSSYKDYVVKREELSSSFTVVTIGSVNPFALPAWLFPWH